MIMIAVNNSTGSTGSLRVSRMGRENKENQMGCLGAGWQGKKEKEACNGEKIYPTAGAFSWDVRQIHHVPAWSWAERRSNCGAALGLFQAKPCGEAEQARQVRQDQVQAGT